MTRQEAFAVLTPPLSFGDDHQIEAIHTLVEATGRHKKRSGRSRTKQLPAKEHEILCAAEVLEHAQFGDVNSIHARNILRRPKPRKILPEKPKTAARGTDSGQLDLFSEDAS
jgi:hypothetical protein